MRKVKVMTISPNYTSIGLEPLYLSGGHFGLYHHVKSKAELVAENRELMKRVARLERCIASIKERGVYITENSWQSDIPQIVSGLKKEGEPGLLCFIPQNDYQVSDS